MLKRNNKAIAIVMAIAICLTFVAPFFAASPAEAASTVTVLKNETVSAIGGYMTLPRVEIDVANVAGLTAGDVLTVHLPSGLKFDNPGGIVGTPGQDPKVAYQTTAGTDAFYNTDIALGAVGPAAISYTGGRTQPNLRVVAPATVDAAGSKNAFAAAGTYVAYAVGSENTLDIKIGNPALFAGTVGRLYIDLNHVLVSDSFDGDIAINMVAPDNSGFSNQLGVVIGKYVSGGKGTSTMAKSVVSMGSGLTPLDVLMVQESTTGALKANEVIKLKLPVGFKWNLAGTTIKGAWGFTTPVFPAVGLTNLGTGAVIAAGAFTTSDGDRSLIVKMPAALAATSEGRVYISDASIIVDDDSLAKKGDVVIAVSSDLGNVTDQDVTVANYVDYSVTAESVSTKDVVSGLDGTELGSFRIAEGIKNSVLPNRTITFSLPEGVKWNTPGATWPQYATSNAAFSMEVEKGNLNTGIVVPTTTSNNGRTLKMTLGAGPYSKSSIIFKKLNVTISPDFTPGDLNVEIGGTAGVTGTVKVATVTTPVTATFASDAKIIIGAQNQAIGDIVLKETKKEAIKAETGANKVMISLPNDATWSSTPTVTVTEGDLSIDSVSTDGSNLIITTKSTSSKLSTITISGIKITTNRNVPEGDFKIKIKANNVSCALSDNGVAAKFDVGTLVSMLVGQCVTPAPSEGTTGSATAQFRISSNIYEVNGVAKVMDAAPYIKAGRTYVPVRYLGLALGVADSDVVWDATAQTATLTLGDKVIVLTIGSTTMTVNGEAKTMDVAPEITNGRTMLPARYVAEGLGYVVGWDASTGTVLVSK